MALVFEQHRAEYHVVDLQSAVRPDELLDSLPLFIGHRRLPRRVRASEYEARAPHSAFPFGSLRKWLSIRARFSVTDANPKTKTELASIETDHIASDQTSPGFAIVRFDGAPGPLRSITSVDAAKAIIATITAPAISSQPTIRSAVATKGVFMADAGGSGALGTTSRGDNCGFGAIQPFLPQRFAAALAAICERLRGLRAAALAAPPFRPPRRPKATAAGFFGFTAGGSVFGASPMDSRKTRWASSLGSRGRVLERSGMIRLLQVGG